MTFLTLIDNQLVKFKLSPNISILQACEIAGIIVPIFCYHECFWPFRLNALNNNFDYEL